METEVAFYFVKHSYRKPEVEALMEKLDVCTSPAQDYRRAAVEPHVEVGWFLRC